MNAITLPSDSQLSSNAFVFGVATSAFQIEGAAEERLPSIWDRFCERRGAIKDGSDGRVACDHYHRWQEDIDLLAALEVDAYRLSIAWPRAVTADGRANQAGLDFYRRILDRLNDKGIKAFVTLYHWDLPQYLEDAGGWQNRETAKHFEAYADVVTRALGDRVYSYATLNEPFCSAVLGYQTGVHAPGIASERAGRFAAHHLLLAHGLGMQVLRTNSPQAKNGIVLNFTPAYAATDSAEDQAAAVLADEAHNQWYLQPVMEGRYPDLIDRLPADQVPEIHAEDLALISAPLDYLGVNYYTRGVYRSDPERGFVALPPPIGSTTEMGWEVFPQGLTDLLVGIHQRYHLPTIYIAENGIAVHDQAENGQFNDVERIAYLQTHLEAVHNAMQVGVDISGYFCWSLMDNFEWAEGYSKNFGLVHVDYRTQQRTVKASGNAFRDLLRQRKQVTLTA
ncbi:MAG: GH1 family beta-glucosidase [Pseudomonadota bacterium]